jgi:hypothetical protein
MLPEAEILRFAQSMRDSYQTGGVTAFDPQLAERLTQAAEAGMRRLCATPLSDPFWYPSNMKPTTYKVQWLAARRLSENPLGDAAAAWTLLAYAIPAGGPSQIIPTVRPLLADDPMNLRWLMSAVKWTRRYLQPFDSRHPLADRLAEASDADPRLRELLSERRPHPDRRMARAIRVSRYLLGNR